MVVIVLNLLFVINIIFIFINEIQTDGGERSYSRGRLPVTNVNWNPCSLLGSLHVFKTWFKHAKLTHKQYYFNWFISLNFHATVNHPMPFQYSGLIFCSLIENTITCTYEANIGKMFPPVFPSYFHVAVFFSLPYFCLLFLF